MNQDARQAEEDLSPDDLAGKWYYATDRERFGPVPLETLRRFIRERKLGAGDLIWRRGMESWQPAGEIPLLRSALLQGKSLAASAPSEPAAAPDSRGNPGRRHVELRLDFKGGSLITGLRWFSYVSGACLMALIPVLAYLCWFRRSNSGLYLAIGLTCLVGSAMLLGVGRLGSMVLRLIERLKKETPTR